MNDTATAVLGQGRGDDASPLLVSGPALGTSTPADWLILLKPRVLTLVVFTGVVGMVVAPGHLHPVLAFAAEHRHRRRRGRVPADYRLGRRHRRVRRDAVPDVRHRVPVDAAAFLGA